MAEVESAASQIWTLLILTLSAAWIFDSLWTKKSLQHLERILVHPSSNIETAKHILWGCLHHLQRTWMSMQHRNRPWKARIEKSSRDIPKINENYYRWEGERPPLNCHELSFCWAEPKNVFFLNFWRGILQSLWLFCFLIWVRYRGPVKHQSQVKTWPRYSLNMDINIKQTSILWCQVLCTASFAVSASDIRSGVTVPPSVWQGREASQEASSAWGNVEPAICAHIFGLRTTTFQAVWLARSGMKSAAL